MAQMAGEMPTLIDTGVPNLDLVLGGGMQQHNSYLIAGSPGAGKSILSQQIAFHRAKQGERVLVITGLDEPHRNLLEHWRTLRFTDPTLVGPQIVTVSLVPFLARPVEEKINVLRTTVLNARPSLVTLDGLRSYAAFADGEQGLHEFIHGLTSWFAVEGITLIMTEDLDPHVAAGNPEFSLVDGVWLLWRDVVNGRTVRRLWIRKMRGQKPLDGLHTFTLDEDGVRVWPRPQATFRLEERPGGEGRLAFGVPELDAMLNGGLPEATATLLGGDAGAGKTLLGLSYLNEGIRQGQPGVWVGFHESSARLLALSRAWSGGLAESEYRERARFLTMAPFELDHNRLAALVQSRVAEVGARRVVLDGAEALAGAIATREEAERFVAWLAQALPQQGVTLLITQRLPAAPGREFDIQDGLLPSSVDNLIVARQMRQGGALRRAIAVLKMSAPGYQTSVRELYLSEHGASVGEPLTGEGQEREPAPMPGAEPVRGPV